MTLSSTSCLRLRIFSISAKISFAKHNTSLPFSVKATPSFLRLRISYPISSSNSRIAYRGLCHIQLFCRFRQTAAVLKGNDHLKLIQSHGFSSSPYRLRSHNQYIRRTNRMHPLFKLFFPSLRINSTVPAARRRRASAGYSRRNRRCVLREISARRDSRRCAV